MDSPRPAASHNSNPRILLVEDDKSVRDATRMLFDVEGFRTTAVGSPEEALREARDRGFDLIVTDFHLQRCATGVELVAALRAVLGASLKAVVITSDTSRTIRQLPSGPGFGVAIKPSRAEELLGLMRALLDEP
jgi:CheY-like chemotaxis protein